MTTPLPPVDRELVVRFWERVVASGVVGAGTAVPVVEVFGDSVELADELIALVVDGPKRATAGSVAELEHAGDAIPVPGDLWIATDGARRPRALLRTAEIRVGPLSSVDDAFAWDEGEGDRTRADWLDAHTRYFERTLPAIGVGFDPDMATVFERFEVLFTE
jgi:uncharacterized protein YhfF